MTLTLTLTLTLTSKPKPDLQEASGEDDPIETARMRGVGLRQHDARLVRARGRVRVRIRVRARVNVKE